MQQLTAEALPPELREENYDYPRELFTGIMRFDGGDDIHIPLVAESDRTAVMARYAVAKTLSLSCAEDRLQKACRLEIEDNPTFLSGVRKIRRSDRFGDLEKGDIELKADELGVYEIVFPLDEKKWRKAVEAERHGDPIEGLDFFKIPESLPG